MCLGVSIEGLPRVEIWILGCLEVVALAQKSAD